MSKDPDGIWISILCADNSVMIMEFITAEYDRRNRPRWTRQPAIDTIEAEIARASRSWEASKKPIQRWSVVQRAEIPAADLTDRTYREAWRDQGGKPVVDMAAARALHRAVLQRKGVNVAPLEPLIAAAQTLADLKAIT